MMKIKNVRNLLIDFMVMGLPIFLVDAASHGRREQRALERHCSDGLADMVKLVCQDRGGLYMPIYNYNDVPTSGPGIVEECCYSSCNKVKTLQRYCMYATDDKTRNSENAGM